MNTTADLILTIISMVGGAIVIGVSGAFVWFRSAKSRIYDRIDVLEDKMLTNANKHTSWHIENTLKLNALEINSSHTEKALEELKTLAHTTIRSIER